MKNDETSYKDKVKEWLRGTMNESNSKPKRPSIEKSSTHGDLKEMVLLSVSFTINLL